jgi:hypothetical protein
MSSGTAGLFERAQRAEQTGNREVRDLWERYRGHRERVTAALLALAPAGGGTLGLLGAGNANDLVLEALAARFEQIHLVDIDPGALSRAVGRQTPAVRARLTTHAPVDLSGLYQQLGRRRGVEAETLVAAGTIEVLRQVPVDFDVVGSLCVLSQMSWALENLDASDVLPVPALQQTLARIHLRSLLRLIRPGGAALLALDMVSSGTYPVDELPPGEDLEALARKLASERVAYPVCNPELVKQLLRRDAELAASARPPELGSPWLWTGPKELTYLVRPLVLRRAT